MLVLAIADALRIAKGFFPVMELPELLLTILVVPLVFVELEIPFVEGFELDEAWLLACYPPFPFYPC